MLDFAQRSVVGAAAFAIPGDHARPATGAQSPSPFGLRALVGRLAGQGDAPPDVADVTARRGVRFTLALAPAAAPEADIDAAEAPEALVDPALRAEAEAAFRTVDGAADRAMDAAMAVMETEITELRTAILTYGEALKSIQTYAAEDAVRALARAALRDRPQRLAAARPVPHLPHDGPGSGRNRHG